ncbi:IS1182 family transposase [Pedobacter jamesrossensis]
MAAQKPAFKPYLQDQLMAFPPTFDELIPQEHPVRVIDSVVAKINLLPLLKAYSIRGASNYHPAMLLKVLLYGYMTNVYSSRKIAEACGERVPFIWLSAMARPDHNTINRFRSVRLKETLRKVFEEVVNLLCDEGLLSIEEVYTDGTKIEANANKYTFVWKKAIQTNKEKMRRQIDEIWKHAQSVAVQDEIDPEPPTNHTVSSERVNAAVQKLNEVLGEKKNIDKKVRAKLGYINKNFPMNIAKYEAQEAVMGERNSCSKTDPDATFMRMKEDHMNNGQLKPGYNVQISTSNQFIVNFTIHSNPTDTLTLGPHIEQHEQSFGKAPKKLTADAGYGSQENYTLLEKKEVEAFVKYSLFDKEQDKNYNSKHSFGANKLFYNAHQDIYICPMGQKMEYIGNTIRKTSSGFEQVLRKYQAGNCSNCPLNGSCHKSRGNRIIEVNMELNRLKAKAYSLLNSEEGKMRRKIRCNDVETVFGNIKQNHGFRRFMLRGKEKAAIEWGLLAIAHNIRKKVA